MKSMTTTTMMSNEVPPKWKGTLKDKNQELRHQAHSGDVKRTNHRQSRQNAIDVVCSIEAWADTGNESTRTLQVIRRFPCVEHQRSIEKTEKDDQCGVDHDVDRLARR